MIAERINTLRERVIGPGAPVVAVVRLTGVIGTTGRLRPGGLSLSSLATPLERAFKQRGLKAVALVINSPGGSAVQSALIGQRVRALAAEHEVPVVAFVEDVAASGGYWLACAADEIFAQEASIVGSIGVVSAGFGFTGLLERIGVERRLYTSGDRKAQLDPFKPEDPHETERLKTLLADIHESFRAMVRERRGAKLKSPEEELFSGEFWTGRRALELGLIDGIGEIRGVMRARYGNTVRLRVIGGRPPIWRRLLRGSDVPLALPLPRPGLAGQVAGELIDVVEERILWSRYGL